MPDEENGYTTLEERINQRQIEIERPMHPQPNKKILLIVLGIEIAIGVFIIVNSDSSRPFDVFLVGFWATLIIFTPFILKRLIPRVTKAKVIVEEKIESHTREVENQTRKQAQDEILRYKEMLDKEIITQEQYEKKFNELKDDFL